MKKEFLEIGKIINTHGVAGNVKLDPWCDTPADLSRLKVLYFLSDGEYKPVNVLKASILGRFVIASLEGVSDVDGAAALKETVVYAARGDLKLKKGDNFIQDLIGLPVVDADTGKEYGKICGVFNAGASDIYEVETPDGVKMIPAVKEFVVSIDTDGAVTVRPIPGMFD